MQSHQLRSGRRVLKVLVGTAVALGALTASVPPALAAPIPSAASGRLAVVTPDDETSIFIAYPYGDFNGVPVNVSGCGPHDLPYVWSYQWIGRGQSGFMYNLPGERGIREATLPSNGNTSSPSPVGWESIFIVC
jgi:hypothetical protein